ncbi:peptidylprolyl isomerase [Patescibacteria group bacterium]|jgi:foldase protein PrsA|nr:peptidylprolyl isomerase [Patescibacteria group bacterium]
MKKKTLAKKLAQFKKKLLSLRKMNVKEVIFWWQRLLVGWAEYFVNLPKRIQRLTRAEIRVKIVRYMVAVTIAYFISAVVIGAGFYLKRIPLNNSFGWVAANVFPLPAEVVGLRAVTFKDIADQEKIIYFFAKQSNSSLGNRLEVDNKVMESVQEVRLAQKTLDKYGIKVSKEDVDKVMSQIEEENEGKEQVEQLLQALYGMSTVRFRSVVFDQLARDKIQSEVLKTIKVNHILVSEEGKAREVKEKVEKGEQSFADAAREHSQDTKANETGGLIRSSLDTDFVGRDSGLAKEFIDAAFALEPGKISDPVKTEFGWHIIKVDEVRGHIDMTYADWLKDAQVNTLIWRLYRP